MDELTVEENCIETPFGPPQEDPFLFNLEPMQKIMVRIDKEIHLKELSDRMGIDLTNITALNYPDGNIIGYERAPLSFKTPDTKDMTPEMVTRWKERNDPDWVNHWHQMPLHIQENREFAKVLSLYFPSTEVENISKITNQNITDKTKAIWYPKLNKGRYAQWTWGVKEPINPRFPIYIISKGRPDCLTSQVLDSMNVPHKIVVEPVDYENYLIKYPKERIHVLPFSNLGKGSIPARNWVWEHSLSQGDKWHWILDDNIEGFDRLYRNTRIRVWSGVVFRIVEDFILRYENIGQAGLNYVWFRPSLSKSSPYSLNTRIYSCILNRNDLDVRWRGKYNEDTDLSLRIMKQGLVTVLFDHFLAAKVSTQIMKGGNTDFVYIDGDNRYRFAKSLMEQHPNECKIVWRHNRWHHQVDYSAFKNNKLKLKKNIVIPEGINNYGLHLKKSIYSPRGILLNEKTK